MWTILILVIVFALLLFHRRIPQFFGQFGRSVGTVGRVGKELATDEEPTSSVLVRYEVQAGEMLAQKYLKEHPPSSAFPLQSRVQTIGERLAALARRSEIPYRFVVVESEEPNAFALPGGLILITLPLVELCNDDNQIAGLLAHEIVHVDRKHAVRNVAAEAAVKAGVRFLTGRAAILSRVSNSMENLVSKGYRQDQEFEADLLGTRLTRQAGFAETGLRTLLETTQQLTGGKTPVVAEAFAFFKSHPPLATRIERLRQDNAGR